MHGILLAWSLVKALCAEGGNGAPGIGLSLLQLRADVWGPTSEDATYTPTDAAPGAKVEARIDNRRRMPLTHAIKKGEALDASNDGLPGARIGTRRRRRSLKRHSPLKHAIKKSETLKKLVHHSTTNPPTQRTGCTNSEATNFDEYASIDDGSCYYGVAPPDLDYSFSTKQRMNPSDALVMYQMAHLVGKLLDKYDVLWWATDGSLLGALRNNGIIPHDDDIDFAVLLPQVGLLKTDDFQGELHENGLHLQLPAGYTDRLYVWNYSEFNRTHGTANERGTRMKLDLWPLMNSMDSWHQLLRRDIKFPGDLCQIKLPDASVELSKWQPYYSCELERWPFGLGEVWIPSGSVSKDYLDKRYGDWKSAPKCEGTVHSCHLIEDITHDLTSYAEPAGPLIEPVPTKSRTLGFHGFE